MRKRPGFGKKEEEIGTGTIHEVDDTELQQIDDHTELYQHIQVVAVEDDPLQREELVECLEESLERRFNQVYTNLCTA